MAYKNDDPYGENGFKRHNDEAKEFLQQPVIQTLNTLKFVNILDRLEHIDNAKIYYQIISNEFLP